MKTRIFMTILALIMAIGHASAKSDDLQYDIQAAGSGQQGTYLLKVFVYSKSKKVTDAEIKKAAIHGVIFRGVPGANGAPSQRPMAASPSVEKEQAEYFKLFFDDSKGIYDRFANIVPGSYERIKAPKGYKVGATIQVMKDLLRQELERGGAIKGLNSGF